MPRDGSAIYHIPPGTQGIPDTTIESTKYNAYTADVEQDLNLPRPIVAGGTGANNARDAMTSLQGDVAYQVVTNYDAYAFVSGSFYSAAGATSAPTANAFIGQCYTSDPAVAPPAVPAGQNMFIEARDVTTGLKYLRQKTAGVWGAWKQLAGSVADLDAAYVNVAGDTMTGTLNIQGTNFTQTLRFTSTTDTKTKDIRIGAAGSLEVVNSAQSAVIARLGDDGSYGITGNMTAGFGGSTGTYYFGNSGTKSLVYDGTNFNLTGGPLFCSAGVVAAASVWSQVTTTTGSFQFGNTGTKSLAYDGAAFNLVGGPLIVGGASPSASAVLNLNGITGSGNGSYIVYGKGGSPKWYEGHRSVIFGGNVSDNLVFFIPGTNKVPLELDQATGFAIVNPAAGGLSVNACALKVGCSGGGTQYGIGVQVQVDNTTLMVFNNSGGTGVGSISETPSTVAFNTSSSGELKEDLKSFDAGNIIDATNVYDFAWKKTGERSYGVIAQQAVEVYPMAVTHSQQDGQEDDFWGVDYSKYVPVLLQELKALRARVAQLEGGTAGKPA